jgi:thiamine-monophosphate kinase
VIKLFRLDEWELIKAIRKEFQGPNKGLLLGIGDDAAVIKSGGTNFVVTKDLLIEDVHFVLPNHPPRLLGRKSLNVNLSDLAAMGALPKYALLGLGLPPKTETKWVGEFFGGFKSAAKEFEVSLIGGDITRASKVTVSVTLLGEGTNIIRRDGAKPGHLLFVSGPLGDAREGLCLMRKGIAPSKNRRQNRMLRAFLNPSPQVELGGELARLKLPSAMIDISDGLSMDLSHICDGSGCGAEVYLDKLPISEELKALQRKALDFALNGGEDYQLLFSVPERNINFLSGLGKKFTLFEIGRMIKEKGIYVVDRRGQRNELQPKPWSHF